jgi:general stress protein 26
MCATTKRSAKVRDKLGTRDFGTGTRGFADVDDLGTGVSLMMSRWPGEAVPVSNGAGTCVRSTTLLFAQHSSEHTKMSDTDRVWELMGKVGTCMLVSWDGDELQARPMGAYVRPDEHAVFFLADARHQKEDDIKKYSKVCLAFSDTSAQNYVSVAGNAEVLVDRAKVRELWGIPAKAWWTSPDDPNIRLLKVTPVDAQYWDAPGSTVAYVKMAAAALTGSRPTMGENRKVTM